MVRIHGMISGPFRQIDADLRVVAIVDPDEEGTRQRLQSVTGRTSSFTTASMP
jgi:hypothetical protein